MEMEPMRGRSVHPGFSKGVKGPGLCTPVENHAIDERSLEEAIQRRCREFSLKLINDIKAYIRKCESDGSMSLRDKDSLRIGDRAWLGQPHGDNYDLIENDSEGLHIEDDEFDDGDGDSVGEGDDINGESSTPCGAGNTHLQDLPVSEELSTGRISNAKRISVSFKPKLTSFDESQDCKMSAASSARNGSGSETPLRAVAIAEAVVEYEKPRSSISTEKRGSRTSISSQLGDVLRGARKSMMPRQKANADLNLPSAYLCLGRDNKKREDNLDFVIGVMVIVNMVQMGFSADCARDWAGWIVVDCLFAIAFLIEFALKILIRGIYVHFIVFWSGSLFDGLIVVAALVELVCDLFVGANLGAGTQSFTILRVVRLLRLARIVKAFRLPMFKDLQQMCEGLITGSQTLFWSMILLMVPIYSSALLLRETVGEDKENKDIVKPFASLPRSFFTTFRCLMGDCANDNGQPLPELLVQKLDFGWMFGCFYVGLVLITFLGVFNVIIAVYVEQIVTTAKKNEALQRRRRLGDVKRMDLLLGNLIHVFVAAKMKDKDEVDFHPMSTSTSYATNSCDAPHLQAMRAEDLAKIQITKSFFDRTMDTEDVQNILEQLAIPSEDRWDLFDILDADGNGHLEIGEIVEGFKKLRGEPRRSDAVANGLIVRALQKRLHSQTQLIVSMAKRIATNVDNIREDHVEYSDMILDKFGSISELLSGVAKVQDTFNNRNMAASECVTQKRPKRSVLI